MERKIFMVLQVSKENTESRKYSNGIYACIQYGLTNLKQFVENGAALYGNENGVEYDYCRERILEMNILEDTYKIERHDFENHSSDLLLDLAKRLSKDYYAYFVLLDTDKEYENHTEPPYSNANVFFEYGVLRAQGKRLALIKQETTKMPWDVSIDNATIIPEQILQFVKDEIKREDSFNDIFTSISTMDKATKILIFQMVAEMLNKINNPSSSETTFNAVLNREDLKNAGFENTRQMLDKITTLFNVLDAKKLLESAMATYINTEKGAFRALTDAVSGAKKSIRTTRFANQSIVRQPDDNDDSPAQEFMEALYRATRQNPDLLCYRIVCNNDANKWWDIYQTLINSNSNMNIFVCKQQYDIHFEIVVIDEKITFLHFYQTSNNEHKDNNIQSENSRVRKIQSTLKITDDTVSKEFAKIFDRLHHRDQDSMSRRLLQVGGNAENIEMEFEGMMLKLESRKNPEVDAKKLLLQKWKDYKEIYDKQSKSSPNNIDKQDYINFTCGLYQGHSGSIKGCGIYYDRELEEAYNDIIKNSAC